MQVEQSPGDCHKILYVWMCEKVHQNTLYLTPWRPTSYMQDSKNKKTFLQRKKKTIGVQLTKEKDFDHWRIKVINAIVILCWLCGWYNWKNQGRQEGGWRGGATRGQLAPGPNLLGAPNLRNSLTLSKAPLQSGRVWGIKGPIRGILNVSEYCTPVFRIFVIWK